jgi:hypothetical protein
MCVRSRLSPRKNDGLPQSLFYTLKNQVGSMIEPGLTIRAIRTPLLGGRGTEPFPAPLPVRSSLAR